MSPYILTTEQYQELYKEVLLFAEIGGVTQDEDGIWKMCQEEYINELIPAIDAEDEIKVIDGVCDSFVVLAQLHHYYLSKPSWEQPLYDDIGWEDAPFFRLEGMLLNRQENLVPGCMANWLNVAKTCAYEYNFNLYKAIKEVNRSNMTKFTTIGEIHERYGNSGDCLHNAALECEELSNGKYKNVTALWNPCTGSDIVVFREHFGNGKIIKPYWAFQEPNFDHCWL